MFKGKNSTESLLKFKNLRLVVLLLLLLMSILLGTPSFAQIPFVDGGVIGDKTLDGTFEYEEYCFLTGEPVILKGIVTVPAIPTDVDTYTQKISFTLSNTDKNITLTRSITYDVIKTKKESISQTLFERKMSKYDETIVTSEGTFTLGKYTYNDSRILDHSPSVTYFSGQLVGERTYYLNGTYLANSGFVKITDEGDPIIGYEHLWGKSETQVIRQMITHTVGTTTWTAAVDVNMASTQKVAFVYQGTDPQNISFRGSYFKVTSEENVLSISYDLPRFAANGALEVTTKRNIGKATMNKRVILETKPLITPKIRDIGDHWSKDNIFLLTSLEIFAVDKEYFAPNASISRLEFSKAVVNAIHGAIPAPTKTQLIKRLRPGVSTPYLDVLPDDVDYQYYEYISANSIMAGENNYFKPYEPITRAQMIVILIKVLGLEYLAPNPPYKTVFTDDAQIPEWSKDYVYMAGEIGLISGYEDGSFKPMNHVTKAEASSMINALINHLKDEISYDYREKIINR